MSPVPGHRRLTLQTPQAGLLPAVPGAGANAVDATAYASAVYRRLPDVADLVRAG